MYFTISSSTVRNAAISLFFCAELDYFIAVRSNFKGGIWKGKCIIKIDRIFMFLSVLFYWGLKSFTLFKYEYEEANNCGFLNLNEKVK